MVNARAEAAAAAMLPSREAMLDWVRNQAPDLRIGHFVEDGAIVTALRLTVDGEEVEYYGPGDAPILECVNELRARHRLPPLGEPSKRDELERDIVAATLAGNTASAEAMTRQLVAHNSLSPRNLNARTRISTRTTW